MVARRNKKCVAQLGGKQKQLIVSLLSIMVPTDGKIDHVPRPYDAIYPRQYIAYRVPPPLNTAAKSSSLPSPAVNIDGNLDKPFWNDVEWSEKFIDIATDTTPQFLTKVKMRWDDDFLYLGMLFVCVHIAWLLQIDAFLTFFLPLIHLLGAYMVRITDYPIGMMAHIMMLNSIFCFILSLLHRRRLMCGVP